MPDDPFIGQHIDQYVIQAVLGHGDLASVYRAWRADTNRTIAVKVLPGELLQNGTFTRRLEEEASAAASVQHPHLVPHLGTGQVAGRPCLLMRYMPGGSLDDVLDEFGPLSIQDAVTVAMQVAGTLDSVHYQGLLHRAVKPGNILFDQAGEVFLGDFSLACVREGAAVLRGLPIGDSPVMVAPEIVRGETDLTPAADVYGLGVSVFKMLTGWLPYESDQAFEQIMMHADAPIPSPSQFNPAISPVIEAVIRRALAKDPAERFQRAGAFATALIEAAGTGHELEPTIDFQFAPGEEDDVFEMTPRPGPLEVVPGGARPAGGRWHETSYPARALSGRDKRRLARLAARQRRAERAAARRLARNGRRWITAGLMIVLLVLAWFVVGLFIGYEARRQANVAEIARIHATQTPAAATAYVDATATTGAYLAGLATGTQQAVLAGQTATAQAPTPTPSQTPTPPPTLTPTPTPLAGGQGLVAFVAERDGDPDIYVLDLKTGQETPITDNDAIDGAPAWSPDGRLLAYHSNATISGWHIFVVDIACIKRPDGCAGSERELTTGLRTDAYPVWSPDGERIAFVSNEARRWYLREVALDGEETELTQFPGSIRLLDWSPNGRVLAFYGQTLDGMYEVMTMPYVGTSANRVAITEGRGKIDFVSYSPDRRQAVYPELDGARHQLYLADATCDILDACPTGRLTDDDYDYLTPRFSPDGTLILTATNRSGNLDLFILNRQGQVVQQLTDRPDDEYDAVWQP